MRTFLTLLMWRAHTFENVGFKTELGKPKQKSFGLEMCLNSKENAWFPCWSTYVNWVHTSFFNSDPRRQFCKAQNLSFPIEVGNGLFKPKKRSGTNLKTSSSTFRHMSRAKFFYLGLHNSNLKLAVSNMCGVPLNECPWRHVQRLICTQQSPPLRLTWLSAFSWRS